MSKRTERKCGICRQPGHTRRTCSSAPRPSRLFMLEPLDVPTCTICYEELSQETNYVATPCKHMFCFTCLSRHLQNDSRCPMCRGELVVANDKPTPTIHSQPNRYRWNQFICTLNNGTRIPLSQLVPVEHYEELLASLSELEDEYAMALVNQIVNETYTEYYT